MNRPNFICPRCGAISYFAEGHCGFCNEWIPSSMDVAKLSGAERLVRAVLLFHRGGEWTVQDQETWVVLTGQKEATTRVLCDFAREVQARHDVRALREDEVALLEFWNDLTVEEKKIVARRLGPSDD